MRKLMILSVMLFALCAYAVPVDTDVGDGVFVTIDEGGDAIISAVVAISTIEPIGAGYLNPHQTYQSVHGVEMPGYLVNGQTYTAKYGRVTASPLKLQRNSNCRTINVILRC